MTKGTPRMRLLLGLCSLAFFVATHAPHARAAPLCSSGEWAIPSQYAFQAEHIYYGEQGSVDAALDAASFTRITGGLSSSADGADLFWTESACVLRRYSVNASGFESIETVSGTPGDCQHDMANKKFSRPTGVVVDYVDPQFAYVADSGAGSIVKVTLADGSTERVVGTGVNAATGSVIEPNAPLETQLKSPTGIFMRGRSLYTVALLSDGAYEAAVVKFNLATGVVSTVLRFETGLVPKQEGAFADIVDWDLFQDSIVLKMKDSPRDTWKKYDLALETLAEYRAPLANITGATGATHVSQVGPYSYLVTVATGIGSTAPYQVYLHDASSTSPPQLVTATSHPGFRKVRLPEV